MKKLIKIMLAVLCTFTLVACSGTGSNATPSEVISSTLQAFKDKDFDKLGEFFDGKVDLSKQITFDGKLDDVENNISNLFLDRLTDIDYEILDETISEDGNSAAVTVKLTTHNLAEKLLIGVKDAAPLMIKLAFENTSAKETVNQVFDALFTPLSQSEKVNIHSITINLTKKGNGWKIGKDNTEFIATMTGGFTNILEQFKFF